MSFPLMPKATPPTFVKGAMTLRAQAFGAVSVGSSSEDRWLIVVGASFSSGSITAFNAPTIDGVAMTQIIQEYSTFGDDGHRGAIWVGRAPSGTSVTLASGGGGTIDRLAVFTLTGVRNPVTSVVTSTVASLTNATGACVVGYFITNFAGVTGISNMERLPTTTATPVIGYDLEMSANTLTYTVSASNPLVFQTKASWNFDY